MIINKTYLKRYSPLPENYDLTEIINYVPVSEKIWIIPIIGQDLFDEIDEQIANNQVSDTNATLLTTGGLWQYLAYATTLEALPFVWAHISQVGITLGKSENSDSISLKDMTLVQDHLRRQVEVLKDQLINWLDEHWESFPLYHPINCQCETCCAKRGKLNNPNPYYQLYTPPRKNTDLK